jgi:hypothetical protein
VNQITMLNLYQPCRRLIGSGMLPGRGGQPTQILLHMMLSQLRDLPGGLAAWAAARASQPGWVRGPEATGRRCYPAGLPVAPVIVLAEVTLVPPVASP